MNDLIRQQLDADYHEVLSSEAGRRVLGSIFYAAGLNDMDGMVLDEQEAAYRRGQRDLALGIANTLRRVNPWAATACEVSYAEMRRKFEGSAEDASRQFSSNPYAAGTGGGGLDDRQGDDAGDDPGAGYQIPV